MSPTETLLGRLQRVQSRGQTQWCASCSTVQGGVELLTRGVSNGVYVRDSLPQLTDFKGGLS